MSAAVSAVLFDLDGTLYHQMPVRAAMVAELGTIGCIPRAGAPPSRLWRVLRTFRRVREELRDVEPDSVDLEIEQYRRTAALAGVPDDVVRSMVREWMFSRPLKYLPMSRRRGVIRALTALRERGVRVGVFSDYPTHDKLAALGLSDLIALEVCATDRSVNAFKPHARGFLQACAIWSLDPSQVVYVGDRPDVDAVGAANAGMRCLIVGAGARHSRSACERVTFENLMPALERTPSRPLVAS